MTLKVIENVTGFALLLGDVGKFHFPPTKGFPLFPAPFWLFHLYSLFSSLWPSFQSITVVNHARAPPVHLYQLQRVPVPGHRVILHVNGLSQPRHSGKAGTVSRSMFPGLTLNPKWLDLKV